MSKGNIKAFVSLTPSSFKQGQGHTITGVPNDKASTIV